MDLVEWHDADQAGPSFEWLMDDLLPEYLYHRRLLQDKEIEADLYVSVEFEASGQVHIDNYVFV